MLHKILFHDLKRQYQNISDELREPMQEVLDSCAFAGGPFTAKFEQDFAEYCDTKFSIGVNNGTSALHLALMTLGIGNGDEVILPANTFIATAWAPSYIGATPVFVDCDEYWNIDVSKIESVINERTRAIIGVHLYGQPCNVVRLREIANYYGIFFIEDAAQAHGATFDNKKVGSFGEMACFSFYPGKNLGAYGEGGAITTDSAEYRDRLHSLRNHGSQERYHHDELGFNMRMDGIQAAILQVKLRHLEGWNARRRQIAQLYLDQIKNTAIDKPKLMSKANSVFHLFVITTENREDFRKFMEAKGIDTALHYPISCHLQKAYQNLGHQRGDFPHSEFLAEHCVSLPMFPELTDQEVNRIIDSTNEY
ncbi:MAG: DegT/DnrJ/EryC1/StrS family aminotransferase [Saprospiraceae bacterium]|nr:DegT/DnrJ/EryC1/StrS family aminotransferase [Saprospiraceae bacterium]